MRGTILLSIFILTLETHLSAAVWPGDKWQTWKGLPRDCYAALGACDRSSILVCPSFTLVIARKGPSSSPYSDRCVDSPQRWAKPVFDAINDKVSLPTPIVWPGRTWVTRAPAEVDMDPDKLAVLADYVGGRGCVVRHGFAPGGASRSGIMCIRPRSHGMPISCSKLLRTAKSPVSMRR